MAWRIGEPIHAANVNSPLDMRLVAPVLQGTALPQLGSLRASSRTQQL
jgi:hypothetical protein